VEAVIGELDDDQLGKRLNSYLTDAHAIEVQALKLLESAEGLVHTSQLSDAFRQHLSETREHERLITARLESRGAEPSSLKDAALKLGALNWGGFFGAQPDTPAKLVVFAYAFEHLEIAGYELLARVAERAGDQETAELAKRIIGEETDAARTIRSLFAEALEETLAERDLA
jgi:ferritin-like metal-binding protein YciE